MKSLGSLIAAMNACVWVLAFFGSAPMGISANLTVRFKKIDRTISPVNFVCNINLVDFMLASD